MKYKDLEVGDLFNTKAARYVKQVDGAMVVMSGMFKRGDILEIDPEENVVVLYSRARYLVTGLIDFLRVNGVKIDSPYDFENFIEDNCSHTQLFATGRFDEEDYDED